MQSTYCSSNASKIYGQVTNAQVVQRQRVTMMMSHRDDSSVQYHSFPLSPTWSECKLSFWHDTRQIGTLCMYQYNRWNISIPVPMMRYETHSLCDRTFLFHFLSRMFPSFEFLNDSSYDNANELLVFFFSIHVLPFPSTNPMDYRWTSNSIPRTKKVCVVWIHFLSVFVCVSSGEDINCFSFSLPVIDICVQFLDHLSPTLSSNFSFVFHYKWLESRDWVIFLLSSSHDLFYFLACVHFEL